MALLTDLVISLILLFCSAGCAVWTASDLSGPDPTKHRSKDVFTVRLCYKTFFKNTIIISLSICFSVFNPASCLCSVPLLSSRVWSQPTVEKLTAKKKEATKTRRMGGWPTGLNWPVCCVGGSSPARRPSSGTSSSLSYTRWLHKQFESNVTLLQTLHES